jgi:hypothetical protein
MAASRNGIFIIYTVAIGLLVLGIAVAIGRFPGGFDWSYTVISKLASKKHNPEGAVWLSGGLLAAMILLWPVAGHLGRSGGHAQPRKAIAALRVGLVGGFLLAIEGLFMLDLSTISRKAHEWLALLTMLGLYGGVLGLYWHRIQQHAPFIWPALLVVLPLLAVGASQLGLYFDQRDLGWVNTSWRELGVPLWLSFAFWQWLAVAVLGAGLGHLVATTHRLAAARGPVSEA